LGRRYIQGSASSRIHPEFLLRHTVGPPTVRARITKMMRDAGVAAGNSKLHDLFVLFSKTNPKTAQFNRGGSDYRPVPVYSLSLSQ